ncbi:MAG: NmrA family NAD(P)-binding protein [Candidatus Electryonea clarkiae]|nr:NmrA family NAD(P)-binding protein [Candidatus Electryonea clarkiae]MDP8285456.1 NmrA family NAD(P)-binding protein [Candidatus Electryonea clarkiae]
MDKTVLVVGATGMLGKPVAYHLRDNGFKVRILARDPEKAKCYFDDSFEIVSGEANNIDSLDESLEGCYGVHINLSGDIELTGGKNVVDAASRKEIKRITYISGTSVCEEHIWFPMIKTKLHVENCIRESGVPFTIFRPTWFMEVIPNFVKETKAFVFGKQPNPYHFIAAEDYARMVATSYGNEDAAGKTFFIHGPEGVLMHDAVKRYCAALRPDLTKITTLPYWMINIIASLKGNDAMKWAGKFAAYFEKVGERGDPTEANDLLGAPKITLDEWIKKRQTETSHSN